VRWLIGHPGPSFSVSDVFAGWREALAGLGEQVATYNLDSRLTFFDAAMLETGRKDDAGHVELRKALSHEKAIELAASGILSACYQLLPDVVLLISPFFMPPNLLDLMRARGSKVILHFTESPYQDDVQADRAAHADLCLINDPTNLQRFTTAAPTWYQPHCYRPSLHHPGPPHPDLECDLGFVGTGFDSRIMFFEAMDLQGLDVLLAGQWQQLREDSPLRKHLAHDAEECLDNEQTAQVYRSARAGLNLYRREADRPELSAGWAMGPREVEMCACQCFFLRDPRPEGDELLAALPTFTSPEQASRQLRWWLDHDRERERAAGKAREAIADRTFHNAAKRLLQHLDQ
jgi:spore maturation protein CgeB